VTFAGLAALALLAPAGRAQDDDAPAEEVVEAGEDEPSPYTDDSPSPLPPGDPGKPPMRVPPSMRDSSDAMTEKPEPYRPSPAIDALRDFRLERSVDVERARFGEPDDPVEVQGLQTLADHLRLRASTVTRELSQGPTVESFELRGNGSDRGELLMHGTSLRVPGTSGPQSNEVVMSELAGFSIVRGGASALYGPNAVGGAVVLDAAQPIPDRLQTRIAAEEGSDDYLRAAFHVEKPFGENWAAFVATETRFVEGFFPGTKESDRFVRASAVTRLPGGMEGGVGWRHWEGDGRSGGFEPELVRSVLTDRDDLRLELFRPRGEGSGTLFELQYIAETITNGIGGPEEDKRIWETPLLRVTTDLPAPGGLALVARAEGARGRVTTESTGEVVTAWQGAGALRATAGGERAFATVTGRADAENDRPTAWQARAEAEWSPGRFSAFGVATHGERRADREAAAAGAKERHVGAEAGVAWNGESLRLRLAGWGSRIRNLRRDPTFEEIRAREPVLDGPIGEGEIAGLSAGLDTDLFAVPGAEVVGLFRFRTSTSWMSAENKTAGSRLPGRPRFSWSGDGSLERAFFSDNLLLRLRGRLTHWHDRVDGAGDPVVDLWMTDVLVEATIGDAELFLRLHDLPNRADEVEPGIRFPGFSRMLGLTWRFRG
jgi:hypothetical protein